jgi:hypothetical protein
MEDPYTRSLSMSGSGAEAEKVKRPSMPDRDAWRIRDETIPIVEIIADISEPEPLPDDDDPKPGGGSKARSRLIGRFYLV